MDPFEAIRRAQATKLVDEDGDEVEFELEPALPPADIDRLADEVGVPLPRELRVLLERTAGGDNPGTLEHSAALASDERLSAFAAELDDRFTFVDLRSPPVGMGFSWGRYGPRTEVRRYGHERLIAYAAPEKRPGLLRRLFA